MKNLGKGKIIAIISGILSIIVMIIATIIIINSNKIQKLAQADNINEKEKVSASTKIGTENSTDPDNLKNKIPEGTYSVFKGSTIGEICIDGHWSTGWKYRNGYCLYKGGDLPEGSNLNSNGNAYDQVNGSVKWLLDNMPIVFSNNYDNQYNKQLNFYRTYIKEKFGVDISGLNKYQVFEVQQSAIWYFTNGGIETSFANGTQQAYYRKLIDVAKNKSSYNSKGTNTEVKIEAQSNKKMTNTIIGYFKLNNVVHAPTTVTITVSGYEGEYSVIGKENGKDKVLLTTSDSTKTFYTDYNGELTIKPKTQLQEGTKYSVTVNMKVESCITNATHWASDGLQPVTTVLKTPKENKAEYKGEYYKPKKVDLALKKMITNIKRAGKDEGFTEVKKENGFNVDRHNVDGNGWKINLEDLKNNTSTNATYTMNKTPVEVSVGDEIQYDIRIYNEGEVAAKASIVKDYLPNGLKIDVFNENVYKATESNGTVTVEKSPVVYKYKDEKGNNQEIPLRFYRASSEDYTSAVNDGSINKQNYFMYNGDAGTIYVYLNGDNYINNFNKNTNILNKDVITVTCKVQDNATGVLTNVAEIEQYKISDGKVVKTDIDSTSGNWKSPTGEEKEKANKGSDAWRNYANGNQNNLDGNWHTDFLAQDAGINGNKGDDDDFEKVIVKSKYSLKLKKVNASSNNEGVNDVKFNITRETSGEQPEVFENVETQDSQIMYEQELSNYGNSSIKYKIEEVENSKYEQLDEPIEIELVVEAGKVQGYYFRYGKSIYPGNGLNGMRTHGESKLTCINQKGVKLNVIVNLSDNNLTVEISNKVIQDSKYGIRFRKISSGDKTPLQGVIFKASKTSFEGENSKPTTTDITLEATNAQGYTNTVIQPIDFNSLKKDTYKITEINLGTNTGYTKLNSEITVDVEKAYINDTFLVKKYTVICGEQKIVIDDNTQKDSFIIEENGVKFAVTGSLDEIDEISTLTLTVTNAPDNTIPLQIRKVSKEDETTLIQGTEYTISRDGLEKPLYENIDLTGTVSLTDNIEAGNNTIIYKVIEENAAEGYDNIFYNKYIKLEVTLENGKPSAVIAKVFNNDDTEDAQLASEVEANVITVENVKTIDLKIKNPKTEKIIDLALKKIITEVDGKEVKESNGIESKYDRLTQGDDKLRVDTTPLKNGKFDAEYYLNKTPVLVQKGSTIKYQIRIYNESSEENATASEIIDYIPTGMEFVNVYYKNEKTPLTVNTDYTYDSDKNVLKISVLNNKPLISKFDGGNELYCDYVTVECKIKDVASGVLTNVAEISEYKTEDGKQSKDRDSEPKNWKNPVNSKPSDNETVNRNSYRWQNYSGNKVNKIEEGKFKNYLGQQDDDDFEKVVVGEIDLVLKKVITQVNTTSVNDLQEKYQRFKNGEVEVNTKFLDKYSYVTTADYYLNKTPIEVKVNDTVTYQIRIYNEGSVDATASEITDYIPKGLELVSVDYKGNVLTAGTDYIIGENNVLKITAMKNNFINKYDGTLPKYDYVTVTCKVNGQVRGLLTNVAEISEYQTFYGATTKDRDSQTQGDGEWQAPQGSDKNTLDGKCGSAWARYYSNIKVGKFMNYAGQQDDDDFEKIKVTTGYTLQLQKISALDNSKGIEGIDLAVNDQTYKTNEQGYTEKLGLYELSNSDGGIGGLDQYKIEEIATNSGKYAKLKSPFWIFIEKKEKDNGEVGIVGYYINFTEPRPEGTAMHNNLKYGTARYSTEDENGNNVDVIISVSEDKLSVGNYNVSIKIENKEKYFDLALRKFIISVNGDKLEGENSRVPQVNTIDLANGLDTTAKYVHSKEPVGVHIKDTVEYGIRVYNEGEQDGYAELIMDDVPEGLEMIVPGDGTDYTSKLNSEYRWKMYRKAKNNEVTIPENRISYAGNTYVLTNDSKEAEVIVTDYLSKVNGEKLLQNNGGANSENINLIKHFDPQQMYEPDYKEVRVEFKVKSTNKENEVIINKAQITEDADDNGNSITDRDSTPNKWEDSPRDDDQDIEKIIITVEKEFDLSLRKFISGVNGNKLEGKDSREPIVDTTKLVSGESTTAEYKHTKEAKVVSPKDVVEYTLRIYNEGEIDGYASMVMDDIPEGVEMVAPSYDESGKPTNLNAEYRWIMYKKIASADESEGRAMIRYNDSIYVSTANIEEAELIVTDYLSKENGEIRMAESGLTGENPNLIKAFNYGSGVITSDNYKDIKVEFKVKPTNEENKEITNYAQITENTDKDGNPVTDRDSTPNKWVDEDDDQDIEKIKVRYFDLALYKWVTKAIVIEDGKATEYDSEHSASDKSKLVNVSIKKEKLSEITVKFAYQIRVENQGKLEGYAKEIKDHIPAGLKFVEEDNTKYGWVLNEEDGTITTDYLKDTLLQPGETADVTVVLTWMNSEENLGEKVNYAEISEDYNDYGAPDKDSTPNNFTDVPKEDDEDGDKVMLQVRTGSQNIIYVAIAVGVITIIAGGIVVIKKFAM